MIDYLLESIDLLRHIDSYSLRWLVNDPAMRCDDLSRALFTARRDLQLYVLASLNRVRRPVVGKSVERHLGWLGWMEGRDEKALRRQEAASWEVGRKVAKFALKMAREGSIIVVETPLLSAESATRLPANWQEIPLPKVVFDQKRNRFCLADSLREEESGLPVPTFDLRNASQEELVRYGYMVAWGLRADGPEILDAIHEHMIDPFSRMCLDLIQGDMDDTQIADICTRKREVMVADLRRKLDLARVGFAALTDYQQELRMGETLQQFCLEVSLAQREPDVAVLALPLHLMTTAQLVEWFLFMAKEAAAHGMLHLEKHLSRIADPYLKKAIENFVDGYDPATQKQILAVRAESILWFEDRKLRMMQTLMNGLRYPSNPRILAGELLAYLPEMPSLEEVLARSA